MYPDLLATDGSWRSFREYAQALRERFDQAAIDVVVEDVAVGGDGDQVSASMAVAISSGASELGVGIAVAAGGELLDGEA